MRPSDFAAQLNVSLANGWGIVRTITDLCMKMPEGKYVLVKDPNKVYTVVSNDVATRLTVSQSVIRLYAVPMNAFTAEDEDDVDEESEEVDV